MPLMLINAEGMPEWFLSKNKRGEHNKNDDN